MLRHFTRNISLILFWLHVLMSHFVILAILILTRYDKVYDSLIIYLKGLSRWFPDNMK